MLLREILQDLYVYETMGGQGSQMAQAMGGMLSGLVPMIYGRSLTVYRSLAKV